MMGKTRKKKQKIDKQAVKFVEVPARELIVWECDLTTLNKCTVMCKPKDDLCDAIVKLVVRYNEGDEELAIKAEQEMVKFARKFAKYVRPVERIVVRSRRTRMPELKAELAPMDALDQWIKSGRLKRIGIKAEVVKRLAKEYLAKVPREKFERQAVEPATIERIGGNNFGPFRGQFEIELSEGIHSVSAKYESSENRSNRAGKSKLMAAVECALYQTVGGNRKGLDKQIYTNEKNAEVNTRIRTQDGSTKDIVRKFSKTQARTFLNGNLVKQGEVGDLFGGLTADDFRRVVFVCAGDLHGILGLGSAQIKEDVMRWHGLGGWDDIHANVVADVRKFEKELENKNRMFVEYEKYMADEKVPCKSEIVAAEERLQSAIGIFTGEVERGRKIKELEERKEVAVEFKKMSKLVKEDDGNAKAWLHEMAERLEMADADVNSMTAKVIKAELDIAECSVRCVDFDGTCPVDDGECPRPDEIRENSEATKRKLGEAKDKLKNTLGGKQRAQKRRDEIKDGKGDALRGLREVNRAKEYLDEHRDKVGDISEIDEQIERLGHCSEHVAERERRDAQDMLADLTAKKMAWDRATERADELSREIKTINDKIKLLRCLALMVGKNGIPAMQIENAAYVIEGIANEVLHMMIPEVSLEFKHEEELKTVKESDCGQCGRIYQDGETKCECGAKRGNARRGVFKPVVREGKRVGDFDQDSQGGQAMLAIATRVALAKFLGVVVLFMDEVCGSLDDTSLEAFIDMVQKLPEMGFKQVFVISHRRRVAERLPSNILVTRHGEWSSVSVGR